MIMMTAVLFLCPPEAGFVKVITLLSMEVFQRADS